MYKKEGNINEYKMEKFQTTTDSNSAASVVVVSRSFLIGVSEDVKYSDLHCRASLPYLSASLVLSLSSCCFIPIFHL